ncbi:MAG TPA: hypothetical protein VGZ00_02050 [Candidatus Baltobacteraceae bacterium]|jgi:ABC-type nickel/cobalt efflux system permease component RcnA|nr:hypothetical protein [Candidatus Baltobacteraceae bacterium]
MSASPELLLIGAVAAVGVLHTVVPDHWVPISLIARQQGWTKMEVARAAVIAGTGHTVSTLLIGLLVWIAGVAFATKFGNLVSTVSSVALIAFGGWFALSSLRTLRSGTGHGHGQGHEHHHKNDTGFHGSEHEHTHDIHDVDDPLYVPSQIGVDVVLTHVHPHRHGRAGIHTHLHDHGPDTRHQETADLADDPPLHEHKHKRSLRTTLLLILGSSPMVEGIPTFFAASKYGIGLIAVMALVFAISTITTYVVMCVTSVTGLEQMSFNAFERYGEVLSGSLIALVGFVFLIFPVI